MKPILYVSYKHKIKLIIIHISLLNKLQLNHYFNMLLLQCFPGIFFVLPCIESYTKVDLRTVSFDVPPQEVL